MISKIFNQSIGWHLNFVAVLMWLLAFSGGNVPLLAFFFFPLNLYFAITSWEPNPPNANS